MPEKCKTCLIYKKMEESDEPCCCIWFIDNVVLGDKSVDDCKEYIQLIEE